MAMSAPGSPAANAPPPLLAPDVHEVAQLQQHPIWAAAAPAVRGRGRGRGSGRGRGAAAADGADGVDGADGADGRGRGSGRGRGRGRGRGSAAGSAAGSAGASQGSLIDTEAVEENGASQAARFERISLLALELSQSHSSGARDCRGGDDDLLVHGSDSDDGDGGGGFEYADDPLNDHVEGDGAVGLGALRRRQSWTNTYADADDEVYEREEGEEEADEDGPVPDHLWRGGGDDRDRGRGRGRGREEVGAQRSSGATAAAMRAATAFGGLPPMGRGRRSRARGASAGGDECEECADGEGYDDEEEYDDGASASLSVSEVSRTSSKRRRDAYREAFPVRGVSCPGCAMANRTGPVERFVQHNIGRMAEDAVWKYAALTWLREVVEPAQAEGAEIVTWAWRDIATHFTLHTTNAVVGRTGIVNGLTACRMQLENTLVRVEGGERTLDKNNVDQYLKVLKMESGERELLGRCIAASGGAGAGAGAGAGGAGVAGAAGGTAGQRPA